MRLPHRMHERPIRFRLVLKFRRQGLELAERVVGLAVGRAVFEVDFVRLAGRFAAFQCHISDFGHRAGGNGVEAAATQDGGLQRQLRG